MSERGDEKNAVERENISDVDIGEGKQASRLRHRKLIETHIDRRRWSLSPDVDIIKYKTFSHILAPTK
jgi:hypothetical protein